MQTAQHIIRSYRRKRAIVCVIVAIFTLFLTLGSRYISERNANQQRILSFTNHAVSSLDRILIPLAQGRGMLLPLVGQPCDEAHLALRKQAATMQTVRSIGLIKNGVLYCSSIFGYRNVPIHQL